MCVCIINICIHASIDMCVKVLYPSIYLSIYLSPCLSVFACSHPVPSTHNIAHVNLTLLDVTWRQEAGRDSSRLCDLKQTDATPWVIHLSTDKPAYQVVVQTTSLIGDDYNQGPEI